MFEFVIAAKYLIPRRRHLALSLISMLSVFVIALVVWLLLLFLSVMQGIERNWIDKLTSLNAPLRVTPTDHYFSSYYHLIDAQSEASNFSYQSIHEKLSSKGNDPYSFEQDRELPEGFPKPDRDRLGNLIDPIKVVSSIFQEFASRTPGFITQDFAMSGGMLKLEMLRPSSTAFGQETQSYLTQASYVLSHADLSPYTASLTLSPSTEDIRNVTARQKTSSTPWVHKIESEGKTRWVLPKDPWGRQGILLAKSYKDNGALIGDRGYISYNTATLASLQEQRIPIYVAGFYDPGILAVGNKCILAPMDIPNLLQSAGGFYALDKTQSSGFLVWIPDPLKAKKFKDELLQAFTTAGIAPYWKITAFYEYDVAKDLLMQFQSDKHLFSLVGILILIVACCNIISLLTMLVNDKKKEIGVLMAMGASRKNIMRIFGICGATIGIIGCLGGAFTAWLTLRNIDSVVSILSALQGHDFFNAMFYGTSLPKSLSTDALLFVVIAAPLISLIAGIIPALRVSRLSPAEILRSE